jgi:hypothetical protein
MPIRFAVFFLLAVFMFGQSTGAPVADPWTQDQAMTPADLAKTLESGHSPAILMVGPRILYNGDHIRGALYAGPAGTEAGLDLLRQQTAKLPLTAEIVLYCGCCPMERCPNIRPAFRTLKEAGFTNVRIVSIPTNLHTDWTEKGFPVEKGSVPK